MWLVWLCIDIVRWPLVDVVKDVSDFYGVTSIQVFFLCFLRGKVRGVYTFSVASYKLGTSGGIRFFKFKPCPTGGIEVIGQ